jgi:signal transduction histidine kinase/ligand-binding sensor domain-containing protein/CheY-like chemotaxis protein/AraC-like DNA-binding protein
LTRLKFVSYKFTRLYRWSLLIVLLSGFSLSRTDGQTPVLDFKHITDEQGLSNTSVEVIFQDSRGFIWIGTRNGLNRYDGYTIRTYFHEATNAKSLSDNYITSIFEDSKQNLWIGTASGLNRFDQVQNHFIRYSNQPALASSITHIGEDDQHTIWVSTLAGGIYQLNAQNETVSRWPYLPDRKIGEQAVVYDFAWDRSGNLWLATSQGLNLFDQATRTLSNFPYRSVSNPQPEPIRKIQMDDAGNLWLATENQGLLMFDRRLRTFKGYRHNDNDPTSLGSDNVKSLLLDNYQNLWVGCLNGGLNRFDPATDSFLNYEREPGNPSSLSQKSVQSLFTDRQENIWIGTLRGGVNVYVPLALKFNLYRQQLTLNSLSYNDIRGFCEDHAGNLWVGADGGGLNRFNRERNTFTHYRHQPGNPRSLGSDAVMSISEDSQHNLWVATFGGGLTRFDPATGTCQQFLHKPGDPTSISSNFVERAFEDSQKNLWVATYGGGLNRLDRQTMTFQPITQDPLGKTKFTGSLLISINEDHDQNVWICTEGGGLNRYDLRTNRFSHYFNEPNIKQDLVVIFTDSKDRLWIGKKGLYLYNRIRDRFELYPNKAGLTNEFIKGILEDKKGNLWISSSNGLTQFNPDTQTFRKFNPRDGLQGLEFEDNSCLMARDGTMFFGGVNGFNTFKPDQLNINRFVPPVYVTEFQVSNHNVGVGSEDSPLTKDISYTDEIQLDYDQSTFSLLFSALNFVVPENNQYAYKLDGLEDDWITAGTERRASYTNLQPGDYTFQVKASNNDYVWNKQPRTIHIVISPPFWATWWFQLLVLILVLYGVFAFFEFRRKLELKAALEKQQNELYQLQLQFFTNISHEFRTPLSLILGPLERIRNINPDQEFAHYYNTIYRNANRLMSLINELMDFRKVETGALKLKVKPGDLLQFLNGIVGEFKDLSAQKQVTLHVRDAGDYEQVWFDTNVMEKIILNLLNNSFKYTAQNGVITVDVFSSLTDFQPTFTNKLAFEEPKRSGNYVYIRIADNGIGISKESITHLFERYFRISPAHLGSGIGLAFVKSLTALHKGDIYVYSERNEGTEIIVGIPADETSYDNAQKLSNVIYDGGVDLESGTMSFFADTVTTDPADNAAVQIVGKDKRESILFVDDNAELRQFLRDTLQTKYQIYEAEEGNAAFEMARQINPDLIVSDVMMPGVNGIEFCNRIKTNFETSHIPFVMLTGRDSLEAKLEGVGSGADIYLSKPISVDLLMLTIRNILEQKKKSKERYLSDYYTEARGLVSSEKDKDLLDKLNQVMEENLMNPELDVEFLCSAIGVSKTSLFQKIKSITGQSIVEFIRTFRLKKSVQLMTEEDVPLSDVAYRVGFQDPSYFSKVFKKEFGKSPSQFLESLRRK